TVHVRQPNNWLNIHIGVQKIEHAVGSYLDLAFLVPSGWKEGDDSPCKFVAFFDSINEAMAAGEFLQRRLPLEHCEKILWFHSDMSDKFKAEALEKLRTREIWDLCATDSFGMGVDLPDITLVIQWHTRCDLVTLWQCLGREAHNGHLASIGLIFVEDKYFESEEKDETRAKRQAANAWKWQ
ncbi:uncharacterized protein PHACADRAFT_106922, partial [Phanerochaete carnosa HHB-10118-sp]